MADGGGAAFFPSHSGTFETLSNEALAAGLDGAGPDLPAVGNISRIVHAVLVVTEVLHLFAIDFFAPPSPALGIDLLPLGE